MRIEHPEPPKPNAGIRLILSDPEAIVTINGRKTMQTGRERTYVTLLEPGKRYRFEVLVGERRYSVFLEAGKFFEIEVDV